LSYFSAVRAVGLKRTTMLMGRTSSRDPAEPIGNAGREYRGQVAMHAPVTPS